MNKLEEKAKEAIKNLVEQKAADRFEWFLREHFAGLYGKNDLYFDNSPREKKWVEKLHVQAEMLRQVGLDPAEIADKYVACRMGYDHMRHLMGCPAEEGE